MSVHAGIQATHGTDSHGHRPQNRPTCANQQAGPLPRRIQLGANVRKARQTDLSPAAVITFAKKIGFKGCF